MGATLLASWQLLAENPPPAGGNQAGGASPLISLLTWMLPMFVLFYLIVLRPQQKERAKLGDMLANLKKNDRVVTIGGVYGVVTNVHREADEITLRIDESTNTKMRVTVSSIARVLAEEPAAGESPPAK